MSDKATILYCRISKEEQDSLESQRARLEQRADAEAWQNVRHVEEAASSTERPIKMLDILKGKIDTGRPKLNAIVRDALAGKVARVAVDNSNRLARDPAERHVIRRLLSELGVELVDLSMPNTGNPLSDYYAQESKGMADGGYKEQLSLDVKRGRDQKAAEGRHQTRPPFGYVLEPLRGESGDYLLDKRGRKVNRVVIVPLEAEAIRHVFELYTQGWSLKRVADWLNGEGFVSRVPIKHKERDESGAEVERSYPRPFAHTSTAIMLANEFYVAYEDAEPDRHGTIIRTRHVTSRAHVCQPCAESCSRPCLIHCQTMRYRGQHEAIVTRSLFEQCERQRVKGRRKGFENRTRRNIGSGFLLWRLARCADCDGPLYAFREGGGYEYYRHREATGCEYDGKLIPKGDLEFDMDTLAVNDLTGAIDVEQRWALVQQLRQETRLTSNRQIAEKRISQLEKERERLRWQHRKGYIEDAEAERELTAIDRQIDGLRPRDDVPAPIHIRDRFVAFLSTWEKARHRGETERCRELLGSILEVAYVDMSRRRVIGIRPTSEYADFYAVGEEGRVPTDWLGWRVGKAPSLYKSKKRDLAEPSPSPAPD